VEKWRLRNTPTIRRLNPSCRHQLSRIAPPAQHRLVIQSVSGILGVTATPNAVTAILRDNTNLTNGLSTFLPPFSATGVLFVQPVLYYVEAQGQPEVDVQAMGNGATFHQSPFMTLSGYLLDCAASPCAPLAQ
jgi:hypothetical protein